MKNLLLVGLLLYSSTVSANGYYRYNEPEPSRWERQGYSERMYSHQPYYRNNYRYPYQQRYRYAPRWACNWNFFGRLGL